MMAQFSTAILVTGEIRRGLSLIDRPDHVAAAGQPILSVWDKVGGKLGGWLGPWQIARLLNDRVAAALPPQLIGFGLLEEFLPDFFNGLRTGIGRRDIELDKLRRLGPHLDIERQQLFVETLNPTDRICNARFIHYKLARAMALMALVEQERGERFRDVVRVRPDLVAIPEWDPGFADNEILADWVRVDECTGTLVIGDNAIVARRAVMAALVEYLRFAIYDERRSNIHDLLGTFVTSHGLVPRALSVTIAEDAWPLDLFIQCLALKVAADGEGSAAHEFLACITASGKLLEGDVAAAVAEIEPLAGSNSPPVVLCRGLIALARGDGGGVDAALQYLRASPHPEDTSDHFYYEQKLEQVRAQYLQQYAAA